MSIKKIKEERDFFWLVEKKDYIYMKNENNILKIIIELEIENRYLKKSISRNNSFFSSSSSSSLFGSLVHIIIKILRFYHLERLDYLCVTDLYLLLRSQKYIRVDRHIYEVDKTLNRSGIQIR